nr:MAG TPA: hypothetical protein [Caudoviricetes sp.]
MLWAPARRDRINNVNKIDARVFHRIKGWATK